ncbi:cytochrome P450 [Nocardia macrotermitis]|uniref:1,8-cineole 2-endo-monooxygenase n=1 Tax=Nocardia macrotermitis TaxID=2585198 RepID=A0A7K0CZU7_9NOCA|nr:cytochrome P450 [Nocardia macrotermitis]MQY18988.1 1,8-cineole 2-endo-monooxygenase [Nocardia macrotermitis]
MTTESLTAADHRHPRYYFDRHTPEYRHHFIEIAVEMQARCPVAWSDTHGGHWVAAGNREVFELARCPHVSNDHDPKGERRGYKGISIPAPNRGDVVRSGILEMDPPEQKQLRAVLNPHLSPAAVQRWIPFVDEVVRAALDEKIGSGRIDFVDDLANVVPAVLTLAMMGIPLRSWSVYNEPAHASVYTHPASPEMARVIEMGRAMHADLMANYRRIKQNPRPGMIDAVAGAVLNGAPITDDDALGMLTLIIGGGFDTTTALTAHSLEWLGEHPAQRDLLSRERESILDSATEEFLRYFTPAAGDGRTFAEDCEVAGRQFKEGERLWLSWAMANRDPQAFENPHAIDMERKGNRHYSFGLGVHRCIGSNMARMAFKRMLLAVLDRMPDYVVVSGAAVHYETIGFIQGMRHLPASFTPGPRLGAGLDKTLDKLQRICDEQRLAEPVTLRKR